MATLLEMASEIVIAHASTTPMTKEELLKEIQDVYAALSAMEKGEAVIAPVAADEVKSASDVKKSITKNAVTCLLCGESMKTLTRHLKSKHNMQPKEYRKQFGIPRTQALAAKAYSESRKQMAIERGLGDKLAAARAAKSTGKPAAKKAAMPKAKKAATVKTKKEA